MLIWIRLPTVRNPSLELVQCKLCAAILACSEVVERWNEHYCLCQLSQCIHCFVAKHQNHENFYRTLEDTTDVSNPFGADIIEEYWFNLTYKVTSAQKSLRSFVDHKPVIFVLPSISQIQGQICNWRRTSYIHQNVFHGQCGGRTEGVNWSIRHWKE